MTADRDAPLGYPEYGYMESLIDATPSNWWDALVIDRRPPQCQAYAFFQRAALEARQSTWLRHRERRWTSPRIIVGIFLGYVGAIELAAVARIVRRLMNGGGL